MSLTTRLVDTHESAEWAAQAGYMHGTN